MVKVIQKNINDISYSTFRLVDIFDPLMMYYIVKNFDGSYENVSVDKVKKTHKYKSFKKKYNDIKELNDVAIVDKKLRVKHKRNDEYKYVFLEDGNKLRIMISSMIGGTKRHGKDIEDSAMNNNTKKQRTMTDSYALSSASSTLVSRTPASAASTLVSGTPASAASAASAQRAPGSIDIVSSEFSSVTPMDVNERQGENEVSSEPLIPQYMEEYFSEENKEKRGLSKLEDIEGELALIYKGPSGANKNIMKRQLQQKINDVKYYEDYVIFLKNNSVEATIGKSIHEILYGFDNYTGIFEMFKQMMVERFDGRYSYVYKNTKIFKKIVLNNVLFYIQEITRFKLLIDNFIEAYIFSGILVQCGGTRNDVCNKENPIFCNLRDRLVRDIVHDFKDLPLDTLDKYIKMFSKNGSPISFENPENYTYGNTKNSLADVEKSYREIIMRKCLDYDLLHFIMMKVEGDEKDDDTKKRSTSVNWNESFLYKVYGDESKNIISYTTDNNISNKIKSKVPVDQLEFYYTVAGIFDPEINQTKASTILNKFLSVHQSLNNNQLTTTKNLNEFEVDLRIMNSISIKYSEYSFKKGVRTDENLEKFLKNVYLHFESLKKVDNKLVFKCKFVYHYGNVGFSVDGMNLKITDYKKEGKKSIHSESFDVPQGLFSKTNLGNFVNVSKESSLVDIMLEYLKDLLSKVHGNDPLLKSDMFSRLYILSLKSLGDYIQFEFVKECNRLLQTSKQTSKQTNDVATKLFITSTDVIAYSQGICNNVPILAGMINPDIFWLFEDISKKYPTIPDDMKEYMSSNVIKRALKFKHIGLFYEGNMKLDSLTSKNTKLNEANWEHTMRTIVNDLNMVNAGFPYLQSKEKFQNWITSKIQLPIKEYNITKKTFEFVPALFKNDSEDIPLRSIHKYVNDIMNIHYISDYLINFESKYKIVINEDLRTLNDLRSNIILQYDIYLKIKDANRTQILMLDKKAVKADEERRSPRHVPKYYKIQPDLNFDYILYLQSYKNIYNYFQKLTQFLIEMDNILESVLTLKEDSESIENAEDIKNQIIGMCMKTINDELMDEIGDTINTYKEQKENELSVNTILQQLKDLRQTGDVRVHEKDFLFNTELQLTNFISVHGNIKKLFTRLKSKYKKVEKTKDPSSQNGEKGLTPNDVNKGLSNLTIKNQDPPTNNTQSNTKRKRVSWEKVLSGVNTEDKPSSQNGEKGFTPIEAMRKVLPNLFISTGTQANQGQEDSTGAVTRAQAARKAANDKGPAFGTRQAAKQQRTIGGANKSAYMKSLKKADEDLAKYLKKKCSIKLLK